MEVIHNIYLIVVKVIGVYILYETGAILCNLGRLIENKQLEIGLRIGKYTKKNK
jgi:hypothetical protein